VAKKVFLQKVLKALAYIDNFTLSNLIKRPRMLFSHKTVVEFFKKVSI